MFVLPVPELSHLLSFHFETRRVQNVAASNADNFDAIAADQTRQAAATEIPYKIPTGDDTESLIGQALLTGRREAAVDLCLSDGRYADAIIIAMTGGNELLARTQYRYLQRQRGYLANIVSALVTDDWAPVVAQCTTDSWREALAATLTHATDQMPSLCEQLGERLRTESEERGALENAILCYICAGNVDRLVEAWPSCAGSGAGGDDAAKAEHSRSIADLQELVEIVTVLQKALELQGRHSEGASGRLAELLAQYAGLLAAQGALSSALTYLGPSDDPQVVDLRERLYHSLGHKNAYGPVRQQQHVQQHNNASRASFGAQQQSRYPQQQQPQQQHNARGSFTSHAPLVPQPQAAWQPPALATATGLPPLPPQQQHQQQQWNTAPMQSGAAAAPPLQNPWNAAPQAPLIPAAAPLGLPPTAGLMPAQPARPPSVGESWRFL